MPEVARSFEVSSYATATATASDPFTFERFPQGAGGYGYRITVPKIEGIVNSSLSIPS
jgi:hypothetical protein